MCRRMYAHSKFRAHNYIVHTYKVGISRNRTHHIAFTHSTYTCKDEYLHKQNTRYDEYMNVLYWNRLNACVRENEKTLVFVSARIKFGSSTFAIYPALCAVCAYSHNLFFFFFLIFVGSCLLSPHEFHAKMLMVSIVYINFF